MPSKTFEDTSFIPSPLSNDPIEDYNVSVENGEEVTSNNKNTTKYTETGEDISPEKRKCGEEVSQKGCKRVYRKKRKSVPLPPYRPYKTMYHQDLHLLTPRQQLQVIEYRSAKEKFIRTGEQVSGYYFDKNVLEEGMNDDERVIEHGSGGQKNKEDTDDNEEREMKQNFVSLEQNCHPTKKREKKRIGFDFLKNLKNNVNCLNNSLHSSEKSFISSPINNKEIKNLPNKKEMKRKVNARDGEQRNKRKANDGVGLKKVNEKDEQIGCEESAPNENMNAEEMSESGNTVPKKNVSEKSDQKKNKRTKSDKIKEKSEKKMNANHPDEQ